MSEIVFEDQALKTFFKNFDTNLKRIKDGHKKFIALLSAVVFKDVMDHFEQEEGEQGKWKPWSASYQEHMEKTGNAGNKKLQFNGMLRQNFKKSSVKHQKDEITWFNNAQTKSNFPYAFAHNAGGPKFPKRDFMWSSDKAVESMADQTLKFLLDEGY